MGRHASSGHRSYAAHLQAWIACAALFMWTAGASAQTHSLAILGISGENVDEALASALTAAMRSEAESLGAYTLTSTRASLSQMTMAKDCEIAEAACRSAVGSALGVEQVIYGSVSSAGDRGYGVELHIFTTDGGRETVVRRDIPRGDADTADFAPHARALLSALRGEPVEPAPAPAPSAAPLAAPQSTAPVARDDESPTGRAEASSGHSSNDWLGYTLLAVGAASTGMTVFSWVEIADSQDSPQYNTYRSAIGVMKPRIDDVCREADAGRDYGTGQATLTGARDACDKGRMFERLQYVFLAAAVVSLGIGTYLLLDDESGDDSARRDGLRVALRPRLGLSGGSLSMRMDF